jgi:NAD(P)-dependent dehydrogenase (short-subunit alcohol dehydrogenase family)
VAGRQEINELQGRSALVTGSGSGIGRATALRFAQEGASVLLFDRDRGAVAATCAEIAANGGRAVVFTGDASSPEDHVAAVAAARDAFGALHIAVNNAGIGLPPTPLHELSVADWDRISDVNFKGVFLGLRAQVPALLATGGGAIVNVASILGSVARRGSGAYTACKHGVLGLTRADALDYAEAGIRVYAVGPGYIRTPLIAHVDEASVVALHPMKRLGEPEEIAELILFLASPRASFTTGGYFTADGGYLAQ